jgi:hypothetical protein
VQFPRLKTLLTVTKTVYLLLKCTRSRIQKLIENTKLTFSQSLKTKIYIPYVHKIVHIVGCRKPES